MLTKKYLKMSINNGYKIPYKCLFNIAYKECNIKETIEYVEKSIEYGLHDIFVLLGDVFKRGISFGHNYKYAFFVSSISNQLL